MIFDMNSPSFGTESPDGYLLHGRPLAGMAGNIPFPAAAFFAWFGRDPSSAEAVLFDACLVASLDHGPNPPSAQAACLVAAAGKPLADAVAAGILAFGPKHGHAGSAAGTWLVAHREAGAAAAVRAALETGSRIPGFGHPVYARDPRAAALFGVLRAQGSSARHADFADAVARELSRVKGREMPVNVDGALGAVCADMAWPAETADMVFLLGRVAGLVAHAREAAAQAGGGYLRGADASAGPRV